MKRTYTFNINGFEVNAAYDDSAVQDIFLPLLREWTAMQRKKGARLIVFLSAPPGTGKTTLAQFLEHLSGTEEGLTAVQAVGLDGYHYHQAYILSHNTVVDGQAVPMKAVKGCPETFDAERLKEKLLRMQTEDVLWPVYDRNLHDVVEDVISVTKPIVLVEGNWLLYSEGPWQAMRELCDDSVFIEAESDLLAQRLIERKIRGGLTREEGEAFYNRSDKRNIERLMARHHKARTTLVLEADGGLRRK